MATSVVLFFFFFFLCLHPLKSVLNYHNLSSEWVFSNSSPNTVYKLLQIAYVNQYAKYNQCVSQEIQSGSITPVSKTILTTVLTRYWRRNNLETREEVYMHVCNDLFPSKV